LFLLQVNGGPFFWLDVRFAGRLPRADLAQIWAMRAWSVIHLVAKQAKFTSAFLAPLS
jgi:hypothetical protein